MEILRSIVDDMQLLKTDSCLSCESWQLSIATCCVKDSLKYILKGRAYIEEMLMQVWLKSMKELLEKQV